MVRDSKFLVWAEIILTLACGGLIFFVVQKELPFDSALIGIMLMLFLLGVTIGCNFARKRYYGDALEMVKMKEGEYQGIRVPPHLLNLSGRESGFRLVWVGSDPSIDQIPLGTNFKLSVTTEILKSRPSGKAPECAAWRVFRAIWKDRAGDFQEIEWKKAVL